MSDTKEIEVRLPSELLLLLGDPLMGPAIKDAVEVIRGLIVKLAESKADNAALREALTKIVRIAQRRDPVMSDIIVEADEALNPSPARSGSECTWSACSCPALPNGMVACRVTGPRVIVKPLQSACTSEKP